jgi:uncharacterized protein
MTAVAPALLIFAKQPVAGAVKTRLARSIGPDRAMRVYCDLLATTLAHAHAAWRARIVSRLELWCDGDPDAPFVRGIATAFGARRYPQREGDLGARMAHAIADALTRSAPVLLIGSDCPLLDPVRIAEAGAALASQDAVLIPAEDGGYVLIGVRAPITLADVRWSTSFALEDTLKCLRDDGRTCATLAPAWDVDDEHGLARWDAIRANTASSLTASSCRP